MDEVLVGGEGLGAVKSRNRCRMLLLTLERRHLPSLHVHDAHCKVRVCHEKVCREVGVLADGHWVVQGVTQMRVVVAYTSVFDFSEHSEPRTALIKVDN